MKTTTRETLRNQALHKLANRAALRGAASTPSRMTPESPGTYLPNTRPGAVWNNVKKEDIGSHFKVIQEHQPSIVEAKKIGEINGYNNRFLYGSSKFISYEVKAVFKTQPKAKIVKPLNIHNKLTKEEKAKLVKKIGSNIDEFADFFMTLLPITLAIPSASQKVDELSQQLTGSKANLPLSFVLNKTNDAVSLLIIRMLSKKFGLSKTESALMLREYTNVLKI
jgi:hypothetical protein